MPSARSRRKAKEKTNKKKRTKAGDVVNPYAHQNDDTTDSETGEEDLEGELDMNTGDGYGMTTEEARPTTSGSDASGETLVASQQDSSAVTSTPTPLPTLTPLPGHRAETQQQECKVTPGEWSYEELPEIGTHQDLQKDEPLTEAEMRHKEIEAWLSEQTGHNYTLKRSTAEKVVDFVYAMKYEQDRAEWMREVRETIWRAAVRANFWWTNPDTGELTGKPAPISAPTGVYEANFQIFVSCAAERLDRIGRDLPDPEYVQQIESAIRLFLRRVTYKKLTRQLENLAFLLLVDEEQNRFLTKDAFQDRLRLCFDKAKTMDWSGLGIVKMGEWPTRKKEPPWRAEGIWEDVLRKFEL